MSPELERLIHLQEVETRALHARQRIADAPTRIAGLDAALVSAREAVDAASEAASGNQAQRRTLDADQAAVQQRLARYKEQLMAVKTNTEYHAMQHQIAATTADLARVEEQILVNMMAADETAARLANARRSLDESDTGIRAERAAIEEDAREAEKELAAAAAERAEVSKGLAPATVAIFDRVLQARHGVALAPTSDGLCSVCHVRLRPVVYNQVRKNDSVVQCESCQRILYFVPPTAPDSADVAETAPSPSSPQ